MHSFFFLLYLLCRFSGVLQCLFWTTVIHKKRQRSVIPSLSPVRLIAVYHPPIKKCPFLISRSNLPTQSVWQKAARVTMGTVVSIVMLLMEESLYAAGSHRPGCGPFSWNRVSVVLRSKLKSVRALRPRKAIDFWVESRM